MKIDFLHYHTEKLYHDWLGIKKIKEIAFYKVIVDYLYRVASMHVRATICEDGTTFYDVVLQASWFKYADVVTNNPSQFIYKFNSEAEAKQFIEKLVILRKRDDKDVLYKYL